MSGQLNMEEYILDDAISAMGEPHMACALLLDVSGSMRGQAIKSLNEGICQFKQQLISDPIARQRVDIAVITFGSTVDVISEFGPIGNMPTPTLKAGGCTEMAKGIQIAIDKVKERTKFYSTLGTPCHKPWIFMITDGVATSSQQEMEDVAKRIQMEESKGSHGHLSFWALGIDNYDPDQLFTLTHRVLELRDQNFATMFDWMSDSMTAISQSHVGERVEFDPLPENARKAQRDRAIGDDWA